MNGDKNSLGGLAEKISVEWTLYSPEQKIYFCTQLDHLVYVDSLKDKVILLKQVLRQMGIPHYELSLDDWASRDINMYCQAFSKCPDSDIKHTGYYLAVGLLRASFADVKTEKSVQFIASFASLESRHNFLDIMYTTEEPMPPTKVDMSHAKEFLSAFLVRETEREKDGKRSNLDQNILLDLGFPKSFFELRFWEENQLGGVLAAQKVPFNALRDYHKQYNKKHQSEFTKKDLKRNSPFRLMIIKMPSSKGQKFDDLVNDEKSLSLPSESHDQEKNLN
jgi:hypothetical protein